VSPRVRPTVTLLATALTALVTLGASGVAASPEPAPIVVGIVLREAGPAFAVIQDPATAKAGFYGVGARIGGALVTAILADRVILEAGDQRTQLRLATSASAGASSSATGPVPLAFSSPAMRPTPRTSTPDDDPAPSPYARIATVSAAAGSTGGDSSSGGSGGGQAMGIAGQTGGPAVGSSGTQGAISVTMTVTGQLHNGSSLQAAEFSATTLRDLLVAMSYSNVSGSHRQRLEFYAPDGSLYQRLSGAVAPSTQTLLPVGGTWITDHALFGGWRVDLYLDRETSPIASHGFTLTP
jgi:hypothetical protein